MPTTPSTVRVDSFLDQVLARHGAEPYSLLQILRDAQARLGWLPPRAITRVARALNLSRARVEGVAGFYSFLYTRPVGRYRVLFASNIIEEMQGAPALMESSAAPSGSSAGGFPKTDSSPSIRPPASA